MLEPLVSSKIRRALIEHLLAHPEERFYLRGLSKELGLSITPLRRELKRLEQFGLLKTSQEANILFYVIDQASPVFSQLKAAVSGLTGEPEADLTASQATERHVIEQAAESSAGVAVSSVLSARSVERIRRATLPSWPWPLIAGALGFGGLVVVIAGSLVYLAIGHQQLMEVTHRAVVAQQGQVAVLGSVNPSGSPTMIQTGSTHVGGSVTTGQMRSARWRLLPGAVGGFSQSGDVQDSY